MPGELQGVGLQTPTTLSDTQCLAEESQNTRPHCGCDGSLFQTCKAEEKHHIQLRKICPRPCEVALLSGRCEVAWLSGPRTSFPGASQTVV